VTVDPTRIRADIDWDLDRLPLAVDQRVSDAALDVLEACEPDRRPTVRRVHLELSGEAPTGTADAGDYAATLRHADGRLAAVTWSSVGATAVRWAPAADAYRVAGYSALDEKLGNESTFAEDGSRRAVTDILTGSTPQVATADETDLLAGGDR
jgi:hypothetical protein